MARILLTNDDGIDAPGLNTLFLAAERFGERVVVAPDTVRSGSGHAVTTTDPLVLLNPRSGWYATSGTPADCSRIALTHLAQDVDLVLSGINRGGNLGADTYISGTVAAAREATFLGKRAIALSQYVRPDWPLDWEWSLRQAVRVLERLLREPLPGGHFWNVNFPHLAPGSRDPELVFCGLDLNPLDVGFRPVPGVAAPESSAAGQRFHYTGKYHGRDRSPGRDVAVCFDGAIAITRIPLDITGSGA